VQQSACRSKRTSTTSSFAETLRAGYAAFADGRIEEALSFLDPDIQIDIHTERPDVPESGFHGHEGFLQNLRELSEPFDDFGVEAEQIVDQGDRVLVVVRMSGRGRASGAAIERRIFQVWTARDGKAVRLEIYSERGSAEVALRS
jgi:ketosteroid isomerase-like protein